MSSIQSAKYWHDLYLTKCQQNNDLRTHYGVEIESLEAVIAEQKETIGSKNIEIRYWIDKSEDKAVIIAEQAALIEKLGSAFELMKRDTWRRAEIRDEALAAYTQWKEGK